MSTNNGIASNFRDSVRTDSETGVALNRNGTRMVAVPVEWFAVLAEASGSQLPSEAFRRLGRDFASRFLDELSTEGDFLDRPMAEFAASLDAALARHGWGRIESDFTEMEQGTIKLEWNGPFPESLAAELLSGIFSYFAEQELNCEPTGEGRFVLTAPRE